MERQSILTVDSISVAYSGIPAIHNVSLWIGDADTVALIGANGAGKTTLLKAIAGTVPLVSGNVLWLNEQLIGQPAHARAASGITHVPEGRRVFGSLSVEENLLMGAYRREARAQSEARMGLVFDLFPSLKDMIRRPAGTLSGGQQQMLAIGRGVMAAPRLMLLDEPSMGLAPLVVEQIFDGLSSLLSSESISLLLVEQKAVEALDLCDRAYVLESGTVVLEGSTEAIAQDDRVIKSYLGGL